MAPTFKDHTQLEISCSADKFFEIFTSKTHLLSKICPDKIQNCDLIEGDGTTIGSVKFWKFVPESGKAEIAEEKIEAIDMLNKSVTFKITQGVMLSYYKNMKGRFTVTTEGEKTFANLCYEYEKLNEAYPAPTQYLEFFVAYSKDIDNYLSRLI